MHFSIDKYKPLAQSALATKTVKQEKFKFDL